MTSQGRRLLVNVFLAGFLAVLAIDACHPMGCNQPLKAGVNLPLLVTGLWQGPWRLYAPDADHFNFRFKADVVFTDQATATWTSPDWTQLSGARKFALARHMNYFNGILPNGEPVWNGLCAYLARTVPHPQGRAVGVAQVTLSLRVATIPDPDEQLVPAGPFLAFGAWEVVNVWRPSL